MKQIIIDFGTLNILGGEFALRIYGYGLMLVLGFLVSIALAQWRAKRSGESTEHIGHVGLLSLIGGIVGARLAFVIEQLAKDYDHAPKTLGEIFNVSSGGLIYFGGLILATLMVLIYLLIKRLPARRYLDILAPSIMVGLAFGRAGCLLNGCCYGAPCGDSFALGACFPMYSTPLIKLDGRPGPFSNGKERQGPTPVYSHQMKQGLVHPDPRLLDSSGRLKAPAELSDSEVPIALASHAHPVLPAQAIGIINALLLAGLLSLFYRLRTREGQVFALMLLLYPITRFMEEAIRDDNIHNLLQGVLTHNQYTSLVLLVVGIILWYWLRRFPACARPCPVESSTGKPVNL